MRSKKFTSIARCCASRYGAPKDERESQLGLTRRRSRRVPRPFCAPLHNREPLHPEGWTPNSGSHSRRRLSNWHAAVSLPFKEQVRGEGPSGHPEGWAPNSGSHSRRRLSNWFAAVSLRFKEQVRGEAPSG